MKRRKCNLPFVQLYKDEEIVVLLSPNGAHGKTAIDIYRSN